MKYENRKKWIAIVTAIIILMAGLSTLDKDSLLRTMARLTERVQKLERILSGVPISPVRIADLSADKITTGVLTLKDGSDKARISVLDVSGNEISTLDLDGLTIKNTEGDVLITLNADGLIVNGGNIIVNNVNGDMVFDALGLVSENNFNVQSTFYQADRSISSSDTWEDIANTTITIDLERPTRVLLMFNGMVTPFSYTNGRTLALQLAFDIDGTRYPDATSGFGTTTLFRDNPTSTDYGYANQYTSLQLLPTLGAGSHTIKVRWYRVSSLSNGNGNAANTTMTAIALGT